jgi:release factor glutamine methyltransferase
VARTSFFGLSLLAAQGNVMTPRAATEQLVASALARVGDRPARVVDVGTGSGAIAIAIASAAPAVDVWATDTSRCAVALARANVRRHGLSDRVTVRQGDLIEPVPDPIDLVVANLPYLPVGDAGRYPDLAGEPEAAVFAPGDGLDAYRRLLAACSDRLDDDAAVMIQLHCAALAATGAELPELRARLERYAPRHTFVPRLAAA